MTAKYVEGNRITPGLQALAVPIDSVKLFPGNPRRGDVGALSESLKKFGQTKPLIVQASTRHVIGGNHLLRAASALGWTEIAANVIDVNNDVAKAMSLADNRMADLGDYEDELLAKMLADVANHEGLEGTGYDEDDLQDLLGRVAKPTGGHGNGDPDASKEPPAEPWVRPGQIFQLGNHRIMCGTPDPNSVARLLGDETPRMLLVQDPPKPADAMALWETLADIREQFWFQPQAYGFLSQIGSEALNGGGLIVWDKQSQNTARDFGDAFELIFSREHHKAEILRHTLVGAADGDRHGGPDFTERPTALFQDLYERYSTFENVILDPYALGATALLAAEKSARMWYGMKANPAYVQGMLEKWAEYIGADIDEIRASAEDV